MSTDTIDAAPADGDVPVTRQCGRCRKHFPVDADVHPMELQDWWVCEACVTALMPNRRRSTTPAGPS